MSTNEFEQQLAGGHRNSLGNTVAVVNEILKNKSKLKNLYDCYQSEDEVVRLRVSNAMKQVAKEKPEWVAEYLDGFVTDIAKIDQASTKWTLATLFMWLDSYLTSEQKATAIHVMKENLRTEDDWIVLNTTSESLAHFAKDDLKLKQWLIPKLKELTLDKHKSVARRAQKLLESLTLQA